MRNYHTAIKVHPSQIACGLPHSSYLYSCDWIKYARVAGLRSQSQANSSHDGGNTISLSEELSHCGAKDVVVTTDLITSVMVESLSKLTVITEKHVDAGRLLKYNVDSLVAVELRNWFTRETGVDAGVFEAMANISKWALPTDRQVGASYVTLAQWNSQGAVGARCFFLRVNTYVHGPKSRRR